MMPVRVIILTIISLIYPLLSFNPHHQFQSLPSPNYHLNLYFLLSIFRMATLVQDTKNFLCISVLITFLTLYFWLITFLSSAHSPNGSLWCNMSRLSRCIYDHGSLLFPIDDSQCSWNDHAFLSSLLSYLLPSML